MLEHFYMRKAICKLMLSSHNLLIETGRYVKPKYASLKRICRHLNLNLIEMGFTFFLSVLYITRKKKKLYDHIHPINSNFMPLCENEKALGLLSQEDNNILSALCTYINFCFEKKRIKDVTITSNKE